MSPPSFPLATWPPTLLSSTAEPSTYDGPDHSANTHNDTPTAAAAAPAASDARLAAAADATASAANASLSATDASSVADVDTAASAT